MLTGGKRSIASVAYLVILIIVLTFDCCSVQANVTSTHGETKRTHSSISSYSTSPLKEEFSIRTTLDNTTKNEGGGTTSSSGEEKDLGVKGVDDQKNNGKNDSGGNQDEGGREDEVVFVNGETLPPAPIGEYGNEGEFGADAIQRFQNDTLQHEESDSPTAYSLLVTWVILTILVQTVFTFFPKITLTVLSLSITRMFVAVAMNCLLSALSAYASGHNDLSLGALLVNKL